ncbi:hypothetical protein BT63DRAFT_455133 [Microthyrium microscopicum]|uniref:Six-hairpin glycosidase n=1 Tax=Microthyrium microscopicum TaxID=703497 RepID=A0A6A6UDH2_9PEZI|nr:hypothetical protein BT63DRAFT_455133 [Microthyrium microscopicum]
MQTTSRRLSWGWGVSLFFLAQLCNCAHEAVELPMTDTLVVQSDQWLPFRSTLYLNSSSSINETETTPGDIPVQGLAKLTQIQVDGVTWTVHEDLSQRDGPIVFVSPDGKQEVFPKNSEASFFKENPKYPRNAGLKMSDIGMALKDLLADNLLKDGEPIEEKVAAIIPPLGSLRPGAAGAPASWTHFIGNVQANDNAPVFGYGSTKQYHPIQKFPVKSSSTRWEGYVGGWMPAVRKIHPVSNTEFTELILFGDVDAKDPFIIQSWHRTASMKNGKITQVVYAHTYPEFGPYRKGPSPEEFYTALFRFGRYWNKHVGDVSALTLPDQSWVDFTKHAFAKELMVRAGGIYPKYGAIDRDYYGSEYDGFQDIFTSSLAANLDWGRFKMAHDVIENYFEMFVSDSGDVNMRGPEVAQFGMTLSLLAKYAKYTGDIALLEKYKKKIVATAQGLVELQNEALKLPTTNPGHGLIHGWSESDACLKGDPDVYWKPYFANSAFSVRGLRDISSLSLFKSESTEWLRRADQLLNRTVASMKQSILTDRKPAYLPPLPGTKKTVRESMATDKPSSQDWPHRLYAELVHAAVLPADLANHALDTMREYGVTSLGVTANVGGPNPYTRDLLGFISYGHAYGLILQDRVDEYILFMYSHRYHVHSRGAWKAAEVSGLNGDPGTFCIPAQMTIPNVVRWALVLEHPDDDMIYLGRAVPRAWLDTGKLISIKQAPTRWGAVNYSIRLDKSTNTVKVKVQFAKGAPKDAEVKLRVPKGKKIQSITVDGQPAQLQPNESVLLGLAGGIKEINVEAKLG